ncbi:hypothetical protein AB6A40_006612 [Gnathostoma spinigerum]|uniref:Choline kinase n=1 Tax=Gnathostoma spinigerum TaxID=75299 RepID=A0ABD6ESA5_9BILA
MHNDHMQSSLVASADFGGMKQLLSEIDPDTDLNSVIELKERVHKICSNFLGGAWKHYSAEEIKLKRMNGGMSNILFICSLPNKCQPIRGEPHTVLIRIYFNPETETHLVAESVIFTLLSERHLGPKLYGIFSGGRIEEFIPSRTIRCTELSVKSVSEAIAKQLAQIHQLDVPIWKEPDYLCNTMERWLTRLNDYPIGQTSFKLPQHCTNGIPELIDCDGLAKELRFIKRCIAMSESPVVFCHNDLQEGNILVPNDFSSNIHSSSLPVEVTNSNGILNSRLIFIDFEYASYNYRAFDFANHFVEFIFSYDTSRIPFYTVSEDLFPTISQQLIFFEAYLKELHHDNTISDLDKKARELIKETLPFIPVCHFFWAVWALLQFENFPVELGYKDFAVDRLGLYYRNRYRLEELLDSTK